MMARTMMPKASVDRLAVLVDDVHFATRLPKHLIMGRLVNVVDRRWAEVEAAGAAIGLAAGAIGVLVLRRMALSASGCTRSRCWR